MTTSATITTAPKLRAKPWTRTEELPEDTIGIPVGYTSAYFRKRNNLAVLRADDNSHYLVFNISTGDYSRVSDTKEASELMSAVRKGVATLTVTDA